MLPPVTQARRTPKQVDFLSDRRAEREQHFKNELSTPVSRNKYKDIDNAIKEKNLILAENQNLR